ncbi:MAG: hypothetical protein JST83_07595 [Bacteroidetes bacterium]|nr:hypothetical protein [Bacteroidota bacterium]
MKYACLLLAILSPAGFLLAQNSFPYDTALHQVIYRQSIKLIPKVKMEDVYAAATAWFADSAHFTHYNAIAPLDTMQLKKPNKRKRAAEEQYANTRPLQMQDPAADKMQGLGVIRYYSSGGSIKLLYLKYDITVEVTSTAAILTVSNIRYYHFDAGSYKQAPIYNFSGGKPFEEVGTLESLIDCQHFNDEFKKLAVYCNKEIYGHIADLRTVLIKKRLAVDGRPPVVTTAKTTSKNKATTKAPPRK